MEKTCEYCQQTYSVRIRTSRYCPSCRRRAKTANEIKRYTEDEEYRKRRNASIRAYAQAHKEATSARGKRWRKANPDKCQKYSLAYYYRNTEKVALKREKQKLREYGLTLEDYVRMLAEQQGVCAICRAVCTSGRKLAVDHDRETGRVRGLLCSNCNLGIGKFRHKTTLLEQAITYLRLHNGEE